MSEGSAFFAGAPRGKRSGVPVGFHVVFGIGGLLVLLVASVLVAVFLVARISGDAERLSGHDVPFANQVAAAALNAKGIANDERGFLLTGDLEFVYEADQRITDARAAFTAAERAAANDSQRAAVRDARRGFESWVAAVRAEFAAFQLGERRATISTALGPDRRLRKTYELALARAQQLAAAATETAQTTVASVSSRTVSILLTCLICSLAIGVAVAVWLIRAILKPVYMLLTILDEPDEAEPAG